MKYWSFHMVHARSTFPIWYLVFPAFSQSAIVQFRQNALRNALHECTEMSKSCLPSLDDEKACYACYVHFGPVRRRLRCCVSLSIISACRVLFLMCIWIMQYDDYIFIFFYFCSCSYDPIPGFQSRPSNPARPIHHCINRVQRAVHQAHNMIAV
jgi:hypothetical protein